MMVARRESESVAVIAIPHVRILIFMRTSQNTANGCVTEAAEEAGWKLCKCHIVRVEMIANDESTEGGESAVLDKARQI